jgi:DNA-binding NtrC family response regulator/tetratricopeptide (TPR) repeat protein
VELLHPSLESSGGEALESAHLTDRQRVSVLLQAAALLSHLDFGGWRLSRGWTGARVDGDGRLCSVKAESGRDGQLPQTLMRDLALALFQGETTISGRGQARRAARRLLEAWEQTLTPVTTDSMVEQVLDSAPFLWEPTFAVARGCLIAEHRGKRKRQLWVAGSGRFRRRVLAAGGDRSQLETILAGEMARSFWEPVRAGEDPVALARRGHWRAAVTRWRLDPPQDSAAKVEFARALFALARFAEAKAELRGLRSVAARVLRARCHSKLGEIKAAERLVRQLESAPLDPQELVDAAELAVRTYGNLGEAESATRWVDRVLETGDPELTPRGELLAADAAWDRQDLPAMEKHLEAARPALEKPQLAWRWYQTRGLAALYENDGDEVIANLECALGVDRRELRPFEASALWNDLAYGRALADDLAGAERAFRHSHRLLGDWQGPRKTTLALFNLAEIRLRRGRLAGVRDILEQTTAENRRAGNLRGMVQDAELWARWELVGGRPAAALEWVDRARRQLDDAELDWRRDALHLLAARALGWMEEPERALSELEETTVETMSELEPEERPAVWALAGDRERALQEMVDSPLAPFWRNLLSSGKIATRLWRSLEELDDYRAARLVFDVELVAPGVVPPIWLRRAIVGLRRVGAAPMVERLQARLKGPWRALEKYLHDDRTDDESLASLFAGAGYPEARLIWRDDTNETVVVAGKGGSSEMSLAVAGGQLSLEAPELDPTLRTLFALAAKDFRPPAGSGRRPGDALMGGIVGESPALEQALDRLLRLATADIPILIKGETGTGKELVAKRVHALSPRAQESFVTFDCASVTESLIGSELFGHVRGAFTGADRDRIGSLELAKGGTVFLDEIGDLPKPAQAKLLRFLQEKEIKRVGESLPRSVDARVVAATHRDLEAMVADGDFRQDLLFRLRVGSVELPPLRDRGGDIELLAEHFLNRMHLPRPLRFSRAAMTKLLGYSWPGNVRELQNIVQAAAALTAGEVIDLEHLDLPYVSAPSVMGFHEKVEDYRRRLLVEALAATGGNRSAAARRLGMSRQNLSYLVRKLGIDVKDD